MNKEGKEDQMVYKVVVNHEGQYSIWPDDQITPHGWRDGDKRGFKSDCLSYIKEVWTDIRPLSLQKKMERPKT
jgi:MbtH protein